MSSLKQRLTKMFGSNLDRIVLTLLNDNPNGYINEEACEELAAILENRSSKYSRQDGLDCLLKQTKKITTWPFALRTLMVFHKLTHVHGDVLRDFLINNQMDSLSKFKVPKSPLKLFVHSAMVQHYYKYLQKLSYNYDDLSICFFNNTEFPKRLKDNNLSVLHFISKVQNMLEYLVGVLPLFEVSLNQFEGSDIVKQITYYCLTDCYYYYSYVNETILAMINEIFHFQEQDAVFLYELYCENIQITKQLKGLFQLKSHLTQFSVKIPNFYVVDVELNKKIELYITSLKKGEVKPPEKKPSAKGLFGAKLEIDVEAAEGPQLCNKLSSSLQDLSNILVQITTPNFKSVQKKELFKPPDVNRKSNSGMSPKVKVGSPPVQAQEAHRVLSDGPRLSPSKGFSDFNPFMAKENYLKVPNQETIYGSAGQVNGLPNKGGYKAIETATPAFSANASISDTSAGLSNN